MSNTTRNGYAPHQFDGRDYVWPGGVAAGEERVLLAAPMPRDQQEVPCCCSMAVVSAMEVLDARNATMTPLSPLFHYYYARRAPQNLGDVRLRDALGEASSRGVCALEFHNPRMDAAGAKQEPADSARSDANGRNIVGYDPNYGRFRYYRLDGNDRVDRWRAALAAGLPIVVGFHTTSSYWNGQGIAAPPAEPSLGGHAALVIGCNDAAARFRVLDSRGVAFADQGLWDLGYATVASGVVIESWVIEAITYDD